MAAFLSVEVFDPQELKSELIFELHSRGFEKMEIFDVFCVLHKDCYQWIKNVLTTECRAGNSASNYVIIFRKQSWINKFRKKWFTKILQIPSITRKFSPAANLYCDVGPWCSNFLITLLRDNCSLIALQFSSVAGFSCFETFNVCSGFVYSKNIKIMKRANLVDYVYQRRDQSKVSHK